MSEPVPSRPHWTTLAVLATWPALLAFAFVAQPHGCAWGTDAYAYAGLAVVGLAVVLPWLRTGLAWLRRLQRAVAFGFAAFAVAVAGFWLAELPLLCP
jgi:hypothetical protein